MAIAVVSEPLGELARVSVLATQPEVVIDGAQAQPIGREVRPRLGKFVGHVSLIDNGRILLNLGRADGVALEDVYELRKGIEDEVSVGRVRVTEIADQSAWAELLDSNTSAAERQTALFSRSAWRDDGSTAKRVLVVNFHPFDVQNQDDAAAGRTFANQLAARLGDASTNLGLDIKYQPSVTVPVLGSDEDGHREARKVGKDYGADIVVWGTMTANVRACAMPRFTIVRPEGFDKARAGDVCMDKLPEGFRLTPTQSEGIAGAILGRLAYEIRRYEDARYYLSRALSRSALTGEEALAGYKMLTVSLYELGRYAEARVQATELRSRAVQAGAESWDMIGRGELAKLDLREGKLDDARKHLEVIKAWSERNRNQGELLFALSELAKLDAGQGRLKEARMGLESCLILVQKNGDAKTKADILQAVAMLEGAEGHWDEAIKRYNESLAIKRAIHDERGVATTLQQLGVIEGQRRHFIESRKFFKESETIKLQLDDKEGLILTRYCLAILDFMEDKRKEARVELEAELQKARALEHAEYQAECLYWLGKFDFSEGRFASATKHGHEAALIFSRLGMVGKARAAEALAAKPNASGSGMPRLSFPRSDSGQRYPQGKGQEIRPPRHTRSDRPVHRR